MSSSREGFVERDGAQKAWIEFLEGEKNVRDGQGFANLLQHLSCWSVGHNTTSLKEVDTATSKESSSKVLYEITKSPATKLRQVRIALEYGADATWTCPFDGRCALHNLAENGQFRILKYISRLKRIPFNVKDKNGVSPLMVAAMESSSRSNTQTVKVLLRRLDCGIDDLDHCGHSALYHAWEKKNFGALRKLLLAKASVCTCVREFAQEIPLIDKLHHFMEAHLEREHSQAIPAMAKTAKPKDLQSFFSATEVHPDMIDVYTNPSVVLAGRALLSGQPRQVADGLVMFGLREELRSMKMYRSSTVVTQDIAVELSDSKEFQAAIQASQHRRQEVRSMKLQHLRVKRKAEEEEAEESRKKAEMERINKMFSTGKGRRDRDKPVLRNTDPRLAQAFDTGR